MIPAIPPIGAGAGSVSSVGDAARAARTQEAGGTGNAFSSALRSVSDSLNTADTLSRQLATGELTDLHQLTAATAKAQLGVELTVAVRNRAVEAFQEIMRMTV